MGNETQQSLTLLELGTLWLMVSALTPRSLEQTQFSIKQQIVSPLMSAFITEASLSRAL